MRRPSGQRTVYLDRLTLGPLTARLRERRARRLATGNPNKSRQDSCVSQANQRSWNIGIATLGADTAMRRQEKAANGETEIGSLSALVARTMGSSAVGRSKVGRPHARPADILSVS